MNPSLLFLDAAFEIFLHLTASPLGVRLNLTTPTLLFLTQIPHLQTYTGKKTSLFCRKHAKEVSFPPFVPI